MPALLPGPVGAARLAPTEGVGWCEWLASERARGGEADRAADDAERQAMPSGRGHIAFRACASGSMHDRSPRSCWRGQGPGANSPQAMMPRLLGMMLLLLAVGQAGDQDAPGTWDYRPAVGNGHPHGRLNEFCS